MSKTTYKICPKCNVFVRWDPPQVGQFPNADVEAELDALREGAEAVGHLHDLYIDVRDLCERQQDTISDLLKMRDDMKQERDEHKRERIKHADLMADVVADLTVKLAAANNILAKLSEPSEAVLLAAARFDTLEGLRAAVAAAEREVGS